MAGAFTKTRAHAFALVVDAGFSAYEETGDVATIVKLVRMPILAPVVFLGYRISKGYMVASDISIRPANAAGFVVAFMVPVTINSFGQFPTEGYQWQSISPAGFF